MIAKRKIKKSEKENKRGKIIKENKINRRQSE